MIHCCPWLSRLVLLLVAIIMFGIAPPVMAGDAVRPPPGFLAVIPVIDLPLDQEVQHPNLAVALAEPYVKRFLSDTVGESVGGFQSFSGFVPCFVNSTCTVWHSRASPAKLTADYVLRSRDSPVAVILG
jgi:hypothetical protein